MAPTNILLTADCPKNGQKQHYKYTIRIVYSEVDGKYVDAIVVLDFAFRPDIKQHKVFIVVKPLLDSDVKPTDETYYWPDDKVPDIQSFIDLLKGTSFIDHTKLFDYLLQSSEPAFDWTVGGGMRGISSKWDSISSFERKYSRVARNPIRFRYSWMGSMRSCDLLAAYLPIALMSWIEVDCSTKERPRDRQYDEAIYDDEFTMGCCERCGHLCASQTTCCHKQFCFRCYSPSNDTWECLFCGRAYDSRTFHPLQYDGENLSELEMKMTESQDKIQADMGVIRECNHYKKRAEELEGILRKVVHSLEEPTKC